MKPQIALSPSQMAELKSLGLDCSDASMCWVSFSDGSCYLVVNEPREESIEIPMVINTPAYTLEDILMKLPNTLEVGCSDSSDTMYYDLAIFSYWNSELWDIRYNDRFGYLKIVRAKDIMKCAFEMLKWVLQNHPDKIKRL